MRLSVCYLLFLLVISGSKSYSQEFEIVSVIKVAGSNDTTGIRHLKFSPTGIKLACQENWRSLLIVDTLGNVTKSIALDYWIKNFEWVTEEQIAVYMTESFDSFTRTHNRLSLFDIESGTEKIISDYETHKEWRSVQGKTAADGIYTTHKGTPYYRLKTFNEDGSIQFEQLLSFDESSPKSILTEQIPVWGEDGLYLRRLNKEDSNYIVEKPFSKMGNWPKVSRDKSWAVDGGQLFNLSKSSIISLDTLIGPLPEKMFGCWISGSLFNPTAPEVIFTIGCEGYATKENVGHRVDYESYRVATFDCESSKITILNPLLNLENCKLTEVSPDGRRISLTSGQKSYIVTRSFR